MSNAITLIESQSNSLVQQLALTTKHPLEEVRGVYDSQFRRLETGARIRTFLPILAARRAREVLSPR